jgi:hypothetical protein
LDAIAAPSAARSSYPCDTHTARAPARFFLRQRRARERGPWVGIVVLCLLFSAESLLCYAETALYIELNDLASIEDLLPLSWLGDLQGLKDTRGTVGVIFFTC